MRKTISLILIVTLVLTFSACHSSTNKQNKTISTKEAAKSTESSVTDASEIEESQTTLNTENKKIIQTDYIEFIEQIKESLADNFNNIPTTKLDISPIFSNGAVYGTRSLGYYFRDLDSDGVDELLFGFNDIGDGGNAIYDIYTKKAGRIVHIASSGDKKYNYFQLCKSGTLSHRNYDSSASNGYIAYYTFCKGCLQLLEAVIEENGNYFYNKENISIENAIAISSEEKYAIINKDEYQQEDILYIPFEEISTETEFEDNNNLTFADLTGKEFWFYSGAGAWRTIVTINADGSYSGSYVDSDISIRYECNFSGNFSSMTKTGPYEYTMQCETLEMEQIPGTQKLFEGRLVEYSNPYGFDEAQEFKIYLPGKKSTELLPGFVSWSNGNAVKGNLKCYGLYNVSGKQGFVEMSPNN